MEERNASLSVTELSRTHRIGASCLWLKIGPFSILVDAGMDPKSVGLDALPDLRRAKHVDAIVLTHCHLDHLGSLPCVAARYPEAEIFASKGSCVLAGRLLRNSYQVMKRQAEEKSIAEYPLYTQKDIQKLEERMRGISFKETRRILNGELELTLFCAGHVAGATGVQLAWKDKSIFLTGDVLFAPQCTLSKAEFPKRAFDLLVLETTRGDTQRPSDSSRKTEAERLIKTLVSKVDNGGSVLIPAFALGRMQEIIALLHAADIKSHLPEVPIFCSGLGADLAKHLHRISTFEPTVHFQNSMLKDLNITVPKNFPRPGKPPKRPGIYVLSSGMMVEHTPAYRIAAALLADPKSALCFAGYCDIETPGGRLLTLQKGDAFAFKALDYTAEIKAHVERFDLSSHAERDELLNFAKASKSKKIVLSHGDPSAREWFAKALKDARPDAEATNLKPGQSCHL